LNKDRQDDNHPEATPDERQIIMNGAICSVARRIVSFMATMSGSPCAGKWVKVDDFPSAKPGSKLKQDAGWTATPYTTETQAQ
jgi:hypothetical protein